MESRGGCGEASTLSVSISAMVATGRLLMWPRKVTGASIIAMDTCSNKPPTQSMHWHMQAQATRGLRWYLTGSTLESQAH